MTGVPPSPQPGSVRLESPPSWGGALAPGTVAFCTLGCKVNQYDSQAMLELFEQAGYQARPFHERADVYVINTCVVTAAGESKSLQALRRARRQNPSAEIVVAGCLAQRDAEKLLQAGARLVIGNRDRAKVVELLHEAVGSGGALCAVGSLRSLPFEPLKVSSNEGHARAVLKIQEGCDGRCAYCIIPRVRGAVRSRRLDEIREEAARLGAAGYREVVLTGIHLCSYGKDLPGTALPDAVRAAHGAEGIRRIRLGSLEPGAVTADFVRELASLPKVCPQFHLSLQSGSDAVLRRMRRRYSAEGFLAAAARLRGAFPGCALTTDVLAGFPEETEEEFQETFAFCRKAGFARMHVFPFSARAGTEAAGLPGQLPRAVKEGRARRLAALGLELAAAYARGLVGTVQEVLFEEERDGSSRGYTPQYLQARVDGAHRGLAPVLLTGFEDDTLLGKISGGTR